jgi:hypothetical protein
MTDKQRPAVPACRIDVTPEDLQREADRSVLYGACLLIARPNTRIKPEIRDAVYALTPCIRAYFEGEDSELAAHAVAYADACRARTFLEQKVAAYRKRQAETTN